MVPRNSLLLATPLALNSRVAPKGTYPGGNVTLWDFLVFLMSEVMLVSRAPSFPCPPNPSCPPCILLHPSHTQPVSSTQPSLSPQSHPLLAISTRILAIHSSCSLLITFLLSLSYSLLVPPPPVSGTGQAERTAKSTVQDIGRGASTRQKCTLWAGEQESTAARSRSRDQNLRQTFRSASCDSRAP